MHKGPGRADGALNIAIRIVDDAWKELQRSPFVQLRIGAAPTKLPEVSFVEAERRSATGRALLQRLDALDSSTLPHDIALTLRFVRFRARVWAREADWYWTVIDPCGIGYFGLFLPTAYCGGYLLNLVHNQLATHTFGESGDFDRYLALIADYARLLEQFVARCAGQAERGIRMPKKQVLQARALLGAFKAGAVAALSFAPQQSAINPSDSFVRELDHRIKRLVEPAFERVLQELSEAYFARAPESVGIGQYAGGAELYTELVKVHTTLELSPEDVHTRGLARMREIEESMRAIRSEAGFSGDTKEFLERLNDDPRWRAETAAGVAAMFHRYIDRVKPRLADVFSNMPNAPYAVAPLPAALQRSMTFGTYDPPRKDRPEGRYLFNSENMTKQALFHVAALAYHELMPGHHLQLATQQESFGLHPFRVHSLVNAYNEGWAEYAAANLAVEIGGYEEPEERYGRLTFDAFLTTRLVVDTGMNAMGWSLERARDYMRSHTGLSEAEVLSESIRYSCDIPGQALAYKLGDTYLFSMRERMRRELGSDFSLKDFHSAVLEPGALPLSDLEWHIDCEIERLRTSAAAEG